VKAELTEEFTERAAVFRRELLAFCYRMLGSAEDAEEVVQETYLSAWRSYDTFEGRSSLRTWLYRIASRACLKALDAAKRRPLPSGIAGPSADPDGEVARSSEATWLQPFPSDPASIVETRATMRLALVAAFQHLPPRQRAVLILRDVLQWRAGEVADLLDMSTTAVNSALQRARAQLPVVPDDVAEPPEPERRALFDRYVTAFETADVNGLAVALAEDVSWEMPPIPTWFAGRDTVTAFLAGRQRMIGGLAAIPATANGQPAFAFYARDADGGYRPHALHVLTLTKAGISRIVSFQDPKLFPLFGLPPAVSGKRYAGLTQRDQPRYSRPRTSPPLGAANLLASVAACATPERGDRCGQRMARRGLCYRNGSPGQHRGRWRRTWRGRAQVAVILVSGLAHGLKPPGYRMAWSQPGGIRSDPVYPLPALAAGQLPHHRIGVQHMPSPQRHVVEEQAPAGRLTDQEDAGRDRAAAAISTSAGGHGR